MTFGGGDIFMTFGGGGDGLGCWLGIFIHIKN
jgi:hypothetical protein